MKGIWEAKNIRAFDDERIASRIGMDAWTLESLDSPELVEGRDTMLVHLNTRHLMPG